MSAIWLFVVGTLVTVIVAVGLSLPVYGAILDGRDEARRKSAASEHDLHVVGGGRRSAA